MDPRQISAGLTCLLNCLQLQMLLGLRLPGGFMLLARPGRAVSSLPGPGWRAGLGPAGCQGGWQDVLKERSEYELLHSHTHPLPISFL